MRWIALATFLAAATLPSVPAVADCVADWEDQEFEASGVIEDVDSFTMDWAFQVYLETPDGCEIAQIFGTDSSPPAQCGVGAEFEASGHFHYNDDDDYHFFVLYMEDALALPHHQYHLLVGATGARADNHNGRSFLSVGQFACSP